MSLVSRMSDPIGALGSSEFERNNRPQAGRPSKRMRLGTKSCTECRRRRVRCIVPDGQRQCQACINHNVQCIPQQAALENEDATQRRLRELEATVAALTNVMTSNSVLNTSSSPQQPERARKILQKSLEFNQSAPGSMTEAIDILTPSSLPTSHTNSHEADSAPLLNVLKKHSVIDDSEHPNHEEQESESNQGWITNNIQSLQRSILVLNDISPILELTQPLWSIWPIFPTVVGGVNYHPSDVECAKTFMRMTLCSDKPAIVAKSALWLALSLQQLQRDEHAAHVHLSTYPEVLFRRILSCGEALVAADVDNGGTPYVVECSLLQVKLYIDMGRPRKAWSCARRAMNVALPLRLQHQQGDAFALWSQSWQYDRHLSLVLGLPPAHSDSVVLARYQAMSLTLEQRVLTNLALVAGHIADLQQDTASHSRSVAEVEGELDQIYSSMSPTFWHGDLEPGQDPAIAFNQQSVRMFYWMYVKYLHLPSMLQSTDVLRRERSRNLTRTACRAIIVSYRKFRQNSRAMGAFVCDIMDFQVFSAALILALDLFGHGEAGIEHPDWPLVQEATVLLSAIHEARNCSVAGQAAELLSNLTAAQMRDWPCDSSYEAQVPYFGKVHIHWPKRKAESPETVPIRSSTESFSSTAYPEVNFSLHGPDLFDFGNGPDFAFGDELNLDWTLNPDIGFENLI